MEAKPWSLAINGSSGAVLVDGTITELTAASVPSLIGEVTGVAPRCDPESLTLIHPKTMTVDEVGELLSELSALGVRAGQIDTMPDTELLARAIYRHDRARDLVVINGASGGAYTRRGAVGEPPISESVSQLVADAGAMSTATVALGSQDETRQVARALENTQVRPKQCPRSRLASLVFDSSRTVNLATKTVPATVPTSKKKKGRYGFWAASAVLVVAGFVGSFLSSGGGNVSLPIGDRVGGSAAGPGGERGYAYWVEPTVGEIPESLPEGATVPERIGHYFQPFDPEPLLNSMPNCFDGGATGVDNLHLYCVGEKSDIDSFAAANGLPELGSNEFSGVSVHFNYMGMSSPGTYDRGECFIDYARLQQTDARYLMTVNEPCTPDEERYEGDWPDDESADITIYDRTRGVIGKDGDELFPVLRIYGLKSREAVDALTDFYGIGP